MAQQYDARCLRAAVAAADGKITEQEVRDAFDRISARKAQLEAAGNLTGSAERLRRFAAEEVERTRIAAAMRRRHAALNAIARDKLDRQIGGYVRDGLNPVQAIRAVFEGVQRGIDNARVSISALRGANERRYLGGLLAEFQAEKPHLIAMMHDPEFGKDVMREMLELKPDGKPGVTGNTDAAFVAKAFGKYAEMARTDLNRMGASIGKLLGWAGPQSHDDVKMIAAGKAAWVGFTVRLLDPERTFSEGVTGPEAARILEDIYDTIITGVPHSMTPGELGQRVNPANLAKSLGKSRVLHFKDADSAIAYQEKFGYGSTVSGLFAHLRTVARIAAVMEVLGPNPEIMLRGVVDTMSRQVKESATYSDRQKQRYTDKLTIQAGVLRQVLDIATGLGSRPVDVSAAKLGEDMRAVQSMGKLATAVVSSVSDTVTAAAAAQFRGNNFMQSWARQMRGVLSGRPQGEAAEIGFLVGDGFDGIIGYIANAHTTRDGVNGALAGMQEKFFRWNGLTWWTDVNRSVASRLIAGEMGMRIKSAFADLPDAYRKVMSMNGIGEADWTAIQKAALRHLNGADYVTPDRIRELPDDAIAPLAADRIAAAKGQPDRVRAAISDARRQLELKVLRFFADETNYAVIQNDARTRRYMTLGQRPGTLAGEAIRLVMQFKGFPLAFTERVGGRALYGFTKEQRWSQARHIGQLLAGLTLAGYASMTVKDLLKGYWPPRSPGDVRSWLAAAQQGGAWGIYGDYLFSQTNRFGGDLLSSLAGPTLGNVAQGVNIALDARDYAISGGGNPFSASNALNWGLQNTPFVNLPFIRPVMEYLWLNSLREALNPGYMRKQQRDRLRQYGQTRLDPLQVGSTLQERIGG